MPSALNTVYSASFILVAVFTCASNICLLILSCILKLSESLQTFETELKTVSRLCMFALWLHSRKTLCDTTTHKFQFSLYSFRLCELHMWQKTNKLTGMIKLCNLNIPSVYVQSPKKHQHRNAFVHAHIHQCHSPVQTLHWQKLPAGHHTITHLRDNQDVHWCLMVAKPVTLSVRTLDTPLTIASLAPVDCVDLWQGTETIISNPYCNFIA